MPTSISRVRARPIDRRRALELMALGALAAAAGCGGADTSADLVGGRRDDDDQPDLEALPPISSNDDFYVLWFLGSPGDVDAS
ncbi:MAG: hypothetical protein VX000_12000, partial [Myxococcota bacterium]|nr:hypothetical protein [Myxococcota bacterium]